MPRCELSLLCVWRMYGFLPPETLIWASPVLSRVWIKVFLPTTTTLWYYSSWRYWSSSQFFPRLINSLLSRLCCDFQSLITLSNTLPATLSSSLKLSASPGCRMYLMSQTAVNFDLTWCCLSSLDEMISKSLLFYNQESRITTLNLPKNC